MNIPTAKPFFEKDDINKILMKVKEVLVSGILTNGTNVQEFENKFAKYIGVKHAVAVNSGTSSLEIALRYFNVKDKEVIVPVNTFISTSNTVIFSGGKPVFTDIRKDTLCIDPEEIKRKITSKTAGVMVVHICGLICPQINEVKEICSENGLFIIEDAAQAHGAVYNHKKAGSLGEAGSFSFYPTKPITTGEGGMITTNNDELAEFAASVRNHGEGKQNEYVKIGYNWRMNEISAILGIQQLKKLEKIIELRNQVAKYYNENLKVKGIELFQKPKNIRHAYYKYPLLLNRVIDRIKIKKGMRKRGVETGEIYYPPIHLQPIYMELFNTKKGMFPISEDVLNRIICLPMFPGLKEEEMVYVTENFKRYLSDLMKGVIK